MNIFDLTFYGIILCKPECKPEIRVSTLKKDWYEERRKGVRTLFTARVLKKFKGNSFVVEIKQYGFTTYVPLFNAKMCYNEQQEKWVECDENEIVAKIIKCYIKNVNKLNVVRE